jgi:hypothetical protein
LCYAIRDITKHPTCQSIQFQIKKLLPIRNDNRFGKMKQSFLCKALVERLMVRTYNCATRSESSQNILHVKTIQKRIITFFCETINYLSKKNSNYIQQASRIVRYSHEDAIRIRAVRRNHTPLLYYCDVWVPFFNHGP